MHQRPTHSVLVELGQHLSSASNKFKRPYKKRKITSTKALEIPFTWFDMFNRNSSEQQGSRQSCPSPLLPTSTSASNIAVKSPKFDPTHQPLDNVLEPTPFRDGTTLELSSDVPGSRPFAIVPQNVFQVRTSRMDESISQQPRRGEEEGIQTSWMATVDRIMGNRSQDATQAVASYQPSSSSLLQQQEHSSQNNLLGFIPPVGSHLQGNEIRRRDQQLAIDDPVDERSDERAKARFRPYQRDQWDQQFKELLKFRQKHGHCHVPHSYEDNPALSRWAKRQRYQYKRKLENKQSSMSDLRQQKLDDVGFVWDLQTMVWQERFNELVEYKTRYGNCNVPCRYDENPTLGMWVKCQRRQFKLFQSGEMSRLTPERFQLLTNLGFTYDPQQVSSDGSIMIKQDVE